MEEWRTSSSDQFIARVPSYHTAVTNTAFPESGADSLACGSGSPLSIDLQEDRLVFGKVIPCVSSCMASSQVGTGECAL